MSQPRRAPQRRDALSPDRIVEAAIEILDLEGEAMLTFKALTARLHTGAGAIYHHIDNKAELLSVATDRVVAERLADLADPAGAADPVNGMRALSLALFDAIDAHPWVGVQLSRNPLPAVLRIWTAVGVHLRTLGVPQARRADAGSTLVNYILGSATQHAAGPRAADDEHDRQAYLDALAERIADLDPGPLGVAVAGQLHAHDDRAQFLAGVDIILTGIASLSAGPTRDG